VLHYASQPPYPSLSYASAGYCDGVDHFLVATLNDLKDAERPGPSRPSSTACTWNALLEVGAATRDGATLVSFGTSGYLRPFAGPAMATEFEAYKKYYPT